MDWDPYVYNQFLAESRKRRPSQSHEDLLFSRSVGEDSMDECNAALVLMSLSCSPHSPHNVAATWGGRRCPASPAASCSDSSWRSSSGTPSPPLTPPHPQNLQQNNVQTTTTTWSLQFTQTPNNNQQQQQQQQQNLQQSLQHSINLHDYSKKSGSNGNSNRNQFANGQQKLSDEGIVSDYDETDRNLPRKKRASSLVFQCTWPGCGNTDVSRKSIEQHVRQVHLGPKTSSSSGSPDSGISTSGGNSRRRHSRRRRRTASLGDSSDRIGAGDEGRLSDDHLSDDENIDDDDSSSSCCSSDHEEEFYYTEVERCDAGRPAPPSPPTLSHRDMARPPHEDPEYQKKIVGSLRQGLLMCKPINIPSNLQQSSPAVHIMNSTPPQKHVRLSPRPSTSYAPYPIPQSANHHHHLNNNSVQSTNLHQGSVSALSHSAPSRYSHGAPLSPSRRTRGENKKCRKVYGMEHRDQWCTQCKWKKACSRFGD